MTMYAYLFEAKSIQNYILDSGRMRDLIGASELVDSLTEELLPDALTHLGYEQENPIRFSRRAGGALYAFCENKNALDRFAALWSLLVAQYAPGLVFDVGHSEGNDAKSAFDKARESLRENTSRVRPNLPVAAPIAERSRRTGNPGTKFEVEQDTRRKQAIDLPTKRKQDFYEEIKKKERKTGLIQRFSPDKANLSANDWPRDLTPDADGAFPYLGDDHTVALIHADGNGMGELLRRAGDAVKDKPDQYISIFRKLSEAIARITQTAAQHATETVLILERTLCRKNGHPNQRLAARPIVLGGDDLTILVRADLALPFLCAFLDKFEDESGPQLAPLNLEDIAGLTAGAGVVFLRYSQPFYLASALAESLAKLARDRAKAQDSKNPPSTLAFHRVTQSMIEDYPEIVRREKTVSIRGEDYINTLGAYALRPGLGIPALDDLFELQGLLQREDMSRGPTRQLQTLMGQAPNQAATAYRRWRTLMKENQSNELEQFDNYIASLLNHYQPDSRLPYAQNETDSECACHSPIGDALTLMAIAKHHAADTEQEAAA